MLRRAVCLFQCSAVTVLKFLILLERGALHFYLALVYILLCFRTRLLVLPQTPVPSRWPRCPAVGGLHVGEVRGGREGAALC